MAEACFIVFSSPVVGREQEYLDWYIHQHIEEIIALPGVVNGRFYQAVPGATGLPGSHVGVYSLKSGGAEHALAEIARQRDAGTMSSCDALDRTAGTTFLIGTAMGQAIRAAGATVEAQDDAPGSLIILTNAAVGKEIEYNAFYNLQHIQDVLRVPGMIAGQSFALRDRRGKSDWQFAAVYAFDTEPEAISAELKRCNGTGEMPGNPHIDPARKMAAVLRALAPLRRAASAA